MLNLFQHPVKKVAFYRLLEANPTYAAKCPVK
jgi:hypothetical protein